MQIFSLKQNKYKKKIIISLMIFFITLPYLANASTLTEDITIKSSSKGHGFVVVHLMDLDFEKRTAKINLYTQLFLNITIYGHKERVFLNIYSDGVYICQIPLENIGNSTSTTFIINTTTSNNINLYNFKGVPEFYPFDCYRFNITFEYSVEFEPTDTEVTLGWALSHYFEGPINLMKNYMNENGKTKISIIFEIHRVSWIAYIMFTPLVLAYIMLGFSSLLHINNDGLNSRLLTYFSILLFILGETIIIQGSLPKGRFYMAVPEGVILGCTISIILFIVFSLISHKYSKNAIITDIIAAILSVAITIFILVSIYVGNPYTQMPALHITPYTLLRILLLQQIITIGLFLGLIFNMYPYLQKIIQDFISYKKLVISKKIITNIYWIAIILSVCNTLITTYVVWIFGSHLELNPFRRLFFDIVKGDFLQMFFCQILLTVLIIPFYYIFKRMDKIFWAFAGIFLLTISIPDFINDYALLLPPEIYAVWFLSIIWLILFSFMYRYKFIEIKD